MPDAVASVMNWSMRRVRMAITSVIGCMPHGWPGMSTWSALSSPFAQRVKKSTPTARTSGSAYGSSMSPARVARALPAATIVAVAPTLVARSQVSLSVRAMLTRVATRSWEFPCGAVPQRRYSFAICVFRRSHADLVAHPRGGDRRKPYDGDERAATERRCGDHVRKTFRSTGFSRPTVWAHREDDHICSKGGRDHRHPLTHRSISIHF